MPDQPASVLRIHPDDDLWVALRDLAAGETVSIGDESLELVEAIQVKHQVATRAFAPGERVRMHGVVVGEVVQPVPAGGAMSTENLMHSVDDYGGRGAGYSWTPPDPARFAGATFQGYPRKSGRAGTANHWVIVPMVFCENRNLMVLKDALLKNLGYEKSGPYQDFAAALAQQVREGAGAEELLAVDFSAAFEAGPAERVFPNVDGVKFLMHGSGCGCAREDSDNLCGLIAGYITHPNVAGATVLSLGCQHAEVEILQREIRKRDPAFDKPLYVFEQQACESEQAMIADAIRKTFAGLVEVNQQRRVPLPVSELCIGVECGASDGFSGISANPSIGRVADQVVGAGGSVILSEFPELCGVEQSLVDRCVDDETAQHFISLLRDYEARAAAVGTGFDTNPSPGNIRDGLITDAIKSAGAAKKGGTSPVVDAIDYPEAAGKSGLTLLCTAGNDVESTTGLAGAGANLILFSTGLGTPTGNAVCPVIKVSTNSEVARRLSDLIDFDAGAVIRGEQGIEDCGDALLDYAIRVASGELVPAAVRLGQDDFLPWKRSISL